MKKEILKKRTLNKSAKITSIFFQASRILKQSFYKKTIQRIYINISIILSKNQTKKKKKSLAILLVLSRFFYRLKTINEKKKIYIYHAPWFHDPEEEDQREEKRAAREQDFHLSKFPSTSAKWNIDTCIEPREDRISDGDKKRRERKEIFYIWRTLYPGYTYGGSRTMITRRRNPRRSVARFHESQPISSGFSFKFVERNGKARLCCHEFIASWFSLASSFVATKLTTITSD